MSSVTAGSEIAFAKINLALHVRRRRDDGYHELESLFAFADQGDRISAEPDDIMSLSVDGRFAPQLGNDPDNLVLRAANAIRHHFGIAAGARLHLEKNLPVASGIGGGSADAAATMRLLARLWSLETYAQQFVDIAKNLGADVPACLSSRLQFGTGRGDELVELDGRMLSGTPLLLVNPLQPLSTASVFARWDGVDRGAINRGGLLSNRNDLSSAAISLVPEIGRIIDELRQLSGVRIAQMSGSGATCFALFETLEDRDTGQQRIAAILPQTWTLAAQLR